MPTKTTTKTAARKPATARKPVKAAAASVKAAPEPKRKETKSVKAETPAEGRVASQKRARSPKLRRRKLTLPNRRRSRPWRRFVDRREKAPPKTCGRRQPRPSGRSCRRSPAFAPNLLPGQSPNRSLRRRRPRRATPSGREAVAPDAAPASPEAEAEQQQKIIHIKPPIIVKDLALQLGLKNFQLIKELMDDFNIFANPNLTVEPDVATQICAKHGFVFEMERREKGGGVHKVEQVVVAPPPPVIEKKEELKTRGPIITFMGHVDHGKTSLMDAIRKTRVAAGEAGGITQHIGAYTVDHKGTRITFLDTPGHAAFTAMRARGAHVTDIVVLVVAADDGLMPQTIEAISHAKARRHVKIMVAINKIDLPGANLDRVKKQLQERELVPGRLGRRNDRVPSLGHQGNRASISCSKSWPLLAEVSELKASPTATPRGTVIEAQVEPGRGPTATVIVQMGTLKIGDPFICGDYGGKVKSLMDDHGKPIKEAGPSTPVKVLGFSGLPQAGDEFLVMESERSAKTLSEERLLERRADKLSAPQRATLESLLEAADGKKHLRIVLKCDAQGSLEALVGALGQIESKKIDLEIVHAGVGPISGIRHPARERVECGRRRIQRQGGEHGRERREARRRSGKALQDYLRADRPDEGSDGRAARSGTSRNRHRSRGSETDLQAEPAALSPAASSPMAGSRAPRARGCCDGASRFTMAASPRCAVSRTT